MVKIRFKFDYDYVLLAIKKDNDILFKEFINPGILFFDLEKGIYKFIFIINGLYTNIPVYIYSKDMSLILNLYYDFKTKYIRLFDYNYKNNKIMKGEIILWQENIK